MGRPRWSSGNLRITAPEIITIQKHLNIYMNNTLKLFLFGFAIAASSPLIAKAQTTFDYSYTFADGFIASGTLAGTQSGEYVDNVSDVTVNFNGTPITGSVFPQNDGPSGWAAGSIVSFDFSLCNFLFGNFDFATDTGSPPEDEWFLIIPNGNGTSDCEAYRQNLPDHFDEAGFQSNWSLVAVPEPATLAWGGLGGFLAIGGLIRRK